MCKGEGRFSWYLRCLKLLFESGKFKNFCMLASYVNLHHFTSTSTWTRARVLFFEVLSWFLHVVHAYLLSDNRVWTSHGLGSVHVSDLSFFVFLLAAGVHQGRPSKTDSVHPEFQVWPSSECDLQPAALYEEPGNEELLSLSSETLIQIMMRVTGYVFCTLDYKVSRVCCVFFLWYAVYVLSGKIDFLFIAQMCEISSLWLICLLSHDSFVLMAFGITSWVHALCFVSRLFEFFDIVLWRMLCTKYFSSF